MNKNESSNNNGYVEPFRISSIDLSRMVYPKSRSNLNKKVILIKYNEKNKLKNFVFQTPTLLNISKASTSKTYAELEIGLVGKEERKVQKLIKFLNDLETKVKTDAQYNASSWFNLNGQNQTVNFQKIIRESSDYSNGTIKLKIIKNNDFETYLQMNPNKRIGWESIPEDSWCKMILEIYAIWVNPNNDFGIFLRPVLVSFTPKEKLAYNYKFVDDSEEENSFDIPDSDVNKDIFMNVEKTDRKYNASDSTSQLEAHELIKQLESSEANSEIQLNIEKNAEPENESEDSPFVSLNNQNNLNELNMHLDETRFSSSDSESESEIIEKKSSSDSTNIDAETSDD